MKKSVITVSIHCSKNTDNEDEDEDLLVHEAKRVKVGGNVIK